MQVVASPWGPTGHVDELVNHRDLLRIDALLNSYFTRVGDQHLVFGCKQELQVVNADVLAEQALPDVLQPLHLGRPELGPLILGGSRRK